MARLKDCDWNLHEGTPNPNGGRTHAWESIHAALLMDIRDELKEANALQRRVLSVLECRNTSAIPHTLARIDKRLAKHLPLKGVK